MTYPDASSFISGAPNAAWWKYQASATETLACQTQGLTLIKNAQRYLRTSGVLADTVWGSTASRATLTIDGIFGPATCKVLGATLIDQGRGSEVLADLEADYRLNNRVNRTGLDYSTPGQPLSMGTIRALIWAASHENGDANRVVLPPAYVAPRWGVAPAPDGAAAGVVSCWSLANEARPVSPTEPAHPALPGPTPPPSGGGGGTPTSGGSGSGSGSSSDNTLLYGLGAAGVTVAAIGIGVAAARGKKRKG